ncbi:hypothetical protein D3C73_1114290 [compost metagenome]
MRQAAFAGLAQRGTQAAQARGAEQLAGGVGGGQGQAGATQCSREVLGQPVGGLCMLGGLAAQLLHQLAGIDAHRAALGAQAGGGAGVDALVLVSLQQCAGIDAGAFFRLNVTPHDDALARAEGQAF